MSLILALLLLADGKLLYQRGADTGAETAVLRPGNVETPARLLACVNCHGTRAEGGKEAGVRIPALRGDITEDGFWKAITEGVGFDGRPLHPAMPAYRFTHQQASALLGYIRTLSSNDAPLPGITGQTIAIGFLQQKDDAIRALVAARLNQANADGIYGRKIELISAPSCEALRSATIIVIAPSQLCPELLQIGPLTSMRPSADTYTLLASLSDQLRLAIDYLRHSQQLPVLLRGDVPLVSEELREPLRAYRADPEVITESAARARAILFVGTSLDGVPADKPILALYPLAGPNLSRKIALVYPSLLPNEMDVERAGAGSPRQSVALAAADLVVEALKRAGRRLTRETFRAAIESIYDFQTHLVPPLSFGPGRTAGSRGAYIVAVEGNTLRPLSDWLKVKD